MVTNRDDDYLICKHYYNNIDKVSSEYPDFITFEHNKNHYFAWVNDGKIILRSEAYPDYERTVRGIKAIIKNRDLAERYSIDSQHGAHFLVLWGGGKDHKHTGNRSEHNEIGRSCPTTNRDDLHGLLVHREKGLADKVVGRLKSSGNKAAAAVAATTAAASLASTKKHEPKKEVKRAAVASTSTTSTASSGGGFKWWWLLPLLLIPLFLWMKGCGGDTKTKVVTEKKEIIKPTPKVEAKTEAKLEVEVPKVSEPKIIEEVKKKPVIKKKKAVEKVNYYGNKSSGF
ncbi:MAG: hypothetical protein V3V00_12370 [Saprospiraceae bacterium]